MMALSTHVRTKTCITSKLSQKAQGFTSWACTQDTQFNYVLEAFTPTSIDPRPTNTNDICNTHPPTQYSRLTVYRNLNIVSIFYSLFMMY